MKETVSIRIETNVIEKLKKQDRTMSGYISEVLENHFQTKQTNYEKLAVIIPKIEDYEKQLEEIYDEIAVETVRGNEEERERAKQVLEEREEKQNQQKRYLQEKLDLLKKAKLYDELLQLLKLEGEGTFLSDKKLLNFAANCVEKDVKVGTFQIKKILNLFREEILEDLKEGENDE